MSLILGRAINSYAKSFISDRIFSLTTITGLHTINHNGRINNPNHIPYRKIFQPVQVHQHRYFSITFSDSLYESVTTSEPTKLVIHLLETAHDLSGLHWWSTIISASVILKLIYSVPCAIYQHKLIAKTELVTIQSKPLIINLRNEILIEGRQKKWATEVMQKNFTVERKKLMNKIMVDNNIHPFKLVILSLSQMPPWVLMTMSISKLARDASSGAADSVAAALQFQVGGPFWCPDLCAPDPTFILPITVSLLTLAVFETNHILRPQNESKVFKIIHYVYRLFTVMLFAVAMQVSSALSLFWTSNAIFGLAQNLALFSPRVRRLFRIPKTPSELEKPYSHLAEQLRNKWKNLLGRK